MLPPVTLKLSPHPATPGSAVRGVVVTVGGTRAGGLSFLFEVDAPAGAVLIPSPVAACGEPRDGLWQHSCLEVFLARDGDSAYREFNFSPSGEWAAYAFSTLRQRDAAAEAAWRSRPESTFVARPNGFSLSATLLPHHLPEGSGALQVGLSAVLETAAGESPPGCSYWALNHPAAQPDFHHRAAFALTLDPLARP